jgi:hypothetical protein
MTRDFGKTALVAALLLVAASIFAAGVARGSAVAHERVAARLAEKIADCRRLGGIFLSIGAAEANGIRQDEMCALPPGASTNGGNK